MKNQRSKFAKYRLRITAFTTGLILMLAVIADLSGILTFFGISPSDTSGSKAKEELLTAEQIINCMSIHGMDNIYKSEASKYQTLNHDILEVTKHKYCEWPPKVYSDPTGYSELFTAIVPHLNVENLSEGTPMSSNDYFNVLRIFSECDLEVQLTVRNLGEMGIVVPLIVRRNSVVDPSGHVIEKLEIGRFSYNTGFWYDQNETDIYLFRDFGLKSIKCYDSENTK